MDEKPKRRRRYERHPSGKRVTPGTYEAVWFQKLWQHGPLTTTYLYEFTKDAAPSLSTVKHRLGDLYHENNTPHGDFYLTRPEEQNRSTKRLDEIHENDDAAEEYLKERGLIPHTSYPCKRTNFRHRFMVSSITASIELACPHADISFIPSQELLERAPSGDLKVPLTISYRSNVSETPLVPDGYFGLRYGGRGVRVFLLEADRKNEPVMRSNLDQTSYLRKMLQYRQLIETGRYKDHFGIRSGLFVLNVTTSYRHMESIIALLMQLTNGKGSSYMLFRTCPYFADKFAVPPLLSELLTEPWRRAGHPDVVIAKA